MGALLAERHNEEVAVSPELSLLNYAESSRVGDWSLRSALVRLAQPDPLRASAVVELIRRVDAALHPHVRALQRHGVLCDRALSRQQMHGEGSEWRFDGPAEPVPDARTADLARLARTDPEVYDRALAAYESAIAEPLGDEERECLPLLAVALQLDELADVLAGWASQGFLDPPLEAVDTIGRAVHAQLEELGVPQEQGPPGRGRRSD